MTDIFLHNTKTRKKERFEPLDAANVRMYVCGPTVYDRAHLGNARPVVVFDTLFRLLRHVYGEKHVTYARNFTDVDDKINARAAESGRSIADITQETTQWFLDDMAALGALPPTHMPRATQYIGEKQPDGSYNHMIGMIEDLIAKGHAYEAEGHVLFAVDSWRAHYGALSGRSVDDMIAGARVDVAPYKHNPMDFVLWKPSSGEQPGWNSPWGYGRPGWHIECSAMSYELLGKSFDIHGGGSDLMFPHHENEIAQSRCAHPDGEFARYWLHNEMLQVEGKKMSKSLGNFFTVRDLLNQGVPGEVIRFVILSTHYHKPMDWTEWKAREAERFLSNLYEDFESALHNVHSQVISENIPEWRKENLPLPTSGIVDALRDDLNTSEAVRVFREHARSANPDDFEHQRQVIANGVFLGFFNNSVLAPAIVAKKDLLAPLRRELEDLRNRAFESKDFTEVDKLKSLLVEAGVEVRMSKSGISLVPQPNFDPAKLEALK
jgi:cysteinyl-tRNA synthetase